ncbi:hypothetical protein PHYBOEH_000015 [Phytophthora boehmeriae]|uniref:Uncharacterized protein n=1 Tax=Phytophthora boehmeriae TaxID=109152 RepID=A0A8T1X809_9STRA|nr:hypothetical protein PHYBOEH_000015 [Phytophthora boehmeriae]
MMTPKTSRSATSVSRYASSRKKSSVYASNDGSAARGSRSTGSSVIQEAGFEVKVLTAKKMLIAVWMCVGLVPLLLQVRSYLKFVTPHKISEELVVPSGTPKNTTEMEIFCPVEGLVIAGAWWNVIITHYYDVEQGNKVGQGIDVTARRICHFVVPQYNIHGAYVLGTDLVVASSTTPSSCEANSYYLNYYFYHGSIGYYSFYEEALGTYCGNDNIGYVLVRGLGTYDSNGASLSHDSGDTTYRKSFWYGIFGSVWIAYRSMLLRRSYISCKRYGRRCDAMREPMLFKDAVVHVQETMRLSAHGARNYHRFALVYLLVEGLMSDLFMLIAQDGFLAKVQYISLGYNLSGVLSILFELVESMNWMREKTRCLIKRLLFNYETALIGEFACAAAMQFYLTGLNKSSLRHTRKTAEAVSYYVWSLVGHGIIVLGIVAVIVSIRSLGAIITVRCHFRSFSPLLAPCSVDTVLGIRSKMILLGGYKWENGQLYYARDTLKAFGLLMMQEEHGEQFMLIHKLHWIEVPRGELLVIGKVDGHCVVRCPQRPCTGAVSMFGRSLGGSASPAIVRPQNLA